MGDGSAHCKWFAVPRGIWQWARTYKGLGFPRSLDELRFRDVAVALVVALTIWGYVDIGPRGRLLPGRIGWHRTDFTVFTEAGAAFFDGRNPYHVTNPRGWYYLYPPLFALMVAPLSVFDTQAQVSVWLFVNSCLAFGCYAEARRLGRIGCEGVSTAGLWFGICCGAAVVLPALDCMQSGQLGIGIVYLLMLGSRLSLRGRTGGARVLGGLLLALPAVVKLVPALPVVFLLAQCWGSALFPGRRRRPLREATAVTGGVALGVFLFQFALPAALLGWNKNLEYLSLWRERVVTNERVGSTAQFNLHSCRNQSLTNALYLCDRTRRLGFPDLRLPELGQHPSERVTGRVGRVGVAACLVVLAVVGCVIGRRPDPLDQATAFGLACWATLVVSPLSWGHYYVVELPALIAVPLWMIRQRHSLAAKAVAGVPVVLSWVHYLGIQTTGRLGILGLGTAAWFVFVSGLMVVSALVTWKAQPVRGAAAASNHSGPHYPERSRHCSRLRHDLSR